MTTNDPTAAAIRSSWIKWLENADDTSVLRFHQHIVDDIENWDAVRKLHITSTPQRSRLTITSRPFPDISDFHETEAEKRRRQADRIAKRARFVAMKPTPEQLAEWDAKNPEDAD